MRVERPDIERMDFTAQVQLYRDAEKVLYAARRELFKEGAVVSVGAPGLHGDKVRFCGIVTKDGECPPDKVACYVQSGNIWWYPVEDVTVLAGGVKDWPRWIRETKLKWLRAETARKQDGYAIV